ncbi:MAG: type II toxin-antitoxin system VapC family toxin [Planctomycetes bacterium]|nr:type II toxin-antitoxin system VapC family toxin [Planctomycetota bacterium]
MNYLVDTNIICEPIQRAPDRTVVEWLREHERDLYVSAITIGELRRGIERLPDGKRKSQLQEWLKRVCDSMHGRVLSFNVSVAHVWGQLKAKWDGQGVALPSIDSQLAATAHRHGLVLVTRNEKDFRRSGIRIENPCG